MRLTNLDGTATFDREILRYQFPEIRAFGLGFELAGSLRQMVTPVRSWEFVDPRLLTMEAHNLANWLADIITDKQTDPRIFFTEPNLSFELVAADTEVIELRLYFALESL